MTGYRVRWTRHDDGRWTRSDSNGESLELTPNPRGGWTVRGSVRVAGKGFRTYTMWWSDERARATLTAQGAFA